MAIIYGSKSVTDVAPSLDLRFSYRKDLVDTMSGKNLIDFSRSSSATYVDADGLIKTAASNEARFDHDPVTGESLGLLVEEARTNNQTYSQHFDKWSRYNVTPIPNAAIAPDDSFTATALIENSGINPAFYLQGAYPGGSTVSGSAISIFCKEIPGSSKRYLCLGMSNPGDFNRCSYIVVDISAKTYVLRQDGFQTFGTNIKIESFANGWIRISGIFNGYLDNAGTFVMLSNTPNPTGGSNYLIPYTGDGRSGVYIWGGQIEYGITTHLTSYIPTPATFTSRASTATYYDANGVIQTAGIDVARDNAYFPDENGVMQPAGLLLEAAGTNFVTYSEEFDNNWWNKSNATIDANVTTSPDGTATADKLIENSTSNSHYVASNGINVSPSTRYTYSIFAKSAERSKIALSLGQSTAWGTPCSAVFDLNQGEVLSTFTQTANVTASIIPIKNGWYRCIMSADRNAIVAAGFAYVVLVDENGNDTYAGNGTSGVYIWGTQLEEGSYATSYIPTTTSTVTRAADVSSSSTVTRSADVAQITGSNFSSWFNSNQGTFFTDCNSVSLQSAISRLAYNTSHTGAFALGTGAPGAGRMYAQRYNVLSNNTITVDIFQYNGSATDFGPGISNVIPFGTDVQKVAFYTDPPNQLYAITTANKLATLNTNFGRTGDYSYTFANMMRIGYNSNYYGNFNGTISRLTYYPQRLQDTTLQKLTR